MNLKAHLCLMAEYNGWMNGRLIDLITPLAPEVRDANRGAFFGSISGTLNHIIAADILWLQRLARHEALSWLGAELEDFPTELSLNKPVYADFNDYIQVRLVLDALWCRLAAEVPETSLDTPLSYTRINGDAHTRVLGLVLSHIFNHQTHHRGQASTLISQLGIDIGVTDLLVHITEMEPEE